MPAAAAAARRADGISLAKATWPLQMDTDRIVAPKLSKSDAAFQTEGCDFVWGGTDLSIEELNKLFVRVSSLLAPPYTSSGRLQRLMSWDRAGVRGGVISGEGGRQGRGLGACVLLFRAKANKSFFEVRPGSAQPDCGFVRAALHVIAHHDGLFCASY